MEKQNDFFLCIFFCYQHLEPVPAFLFVLCCSIDPVSPCEVIKIVSNLRRLKLVEAGDGLLGPDRPALGHYVTIVQQHSA